MKKITRALSLCCALIMCFSLMSMSASAASEKTKVSSYGASYFEDEWEKTTKYKVGSTEVGYLIWGYDKDFTNEDYACTVGYECSTQAAIKRTSYDSDYLTGTWGQAYLYGKQELKHQTFGVSYKIIFSATYSGLAEGTTKNTSVK